MPLQDLCAAHPKLFNVSLQPVSRDVWVGLTPSAAVRFMPLMAKQRQQQQQQEQQQQQQQEQQQRQQQQQQLVTCMLAAATKAAASVENWQT